MNLRLCFVLYSFLIILKFTVAAGETNVSQNKSTGAIKKSQDNLYDEDDTEGSGNSEEAFTSDGKYDSESSGSGYGPDDEDSTHHAATFSGINTNLRSITESAELPNSPETEIPLITSKPPEEPDEESYPAQPSNTITKVTSSEKKPPDVSSTNKQDNDVVQTSSTADKTPPIEDNTQVYVVNNQDKDKTISFFAQPGILAAVIGGAVVGLLCAILIVMLIVYRMRKKDEGSYALDEMKRSPASNPYMKTNNHREFYA